MNLKSLILYLPFIVHLSHAVPVNNITVAYNLHQNLSVYDINELGKDQRIKALLDVQTTIDEVEKLLIADPSLPRLTKGEIRDLFEKVTHDELKQSITDGDKEKQEFMKNLILALPYHSDEFIKIDNLASSKASTMHPIIEPTIPEELKVLLTNHGLLNDNKTIGLEKLPVLPNNDYPALTATKSDNKRKTNTKNNKTPTTNPDSFTSFKQLTVDNRNVSSDIGKFLNKFGLFDNRTNQTNSKREKASSTKIIPSYVSPEFSGVLKEMGLQKPKSEALTSSQTTAPDPVKEFKRGSQKKNDFKRQDSPTKINIGLNDRPLLESSLEATDVDITTTTSRAPKITTTNAKPSTVITTTTEKVSTTTEEEKKNNLEDDIDAVDEPAQLPGPRRSGFYMIFDWNTFLEVGEDPEKIIVRFDPKIGDPTRFLPVNIP